jgi:hypothetical protein
MGCKRGGNPFTPSTSLVLRDLFLSAELKGVDRPVSLLDMSERTGLNEWSIIRIAACLRKHGFASRRRFALRLMDPARVIDAWMASWDGERQVTESFYIALPWKKLVAELTPRWKGLEWAWTGAAGAALVADVGVPLHRVCYVAERHEREAKERLVSLLDAIPVPANERGLFHIMVPFHERSQFYGRHQSSVGAPVVSTLQMMLDLGQAPGGPERDSVMAAARRALMSMLLREARSVGSALAAVA